MNHTQTVDNTFKPFAILTPRLIILPTPIAVSQESYRALYGRLHSDVGFCEMAFGEHFPPVKWDDNKTREVIETRDIGLCWNVLGLGDFAVGLRVSLGCCTNDLNDQFAPNDNSPLAIIKGSEFEELVGSSYDRLKGLTWVGYAGVRDATTTSLLAVRKGTELADLPPWYEMVELRYGFSPEVWGKGIAKEAAEAVMQWSVKERGVKRFIAETEKGNPRSGRVLEKLGFRPSGTDYFKEPSEVEWEWILE